MSTTSNLATAHNSLRVLEAEECMKVLRSGDVGRIGFLSDGQVEVLPVNYVVDGDDIAFRTTGGSKLTPATQYGDVTFEVDDLRSESREGSSVVIKGWADAVSDLERLARLDDSGLRPWADDVTRPIWVLIHPREITGRAVGGTIPAART